jgi:hypothetical protein
MARSATRETNSFESQLELGEMLLRMGRVEEATLELAKANQLQKSGVIATPTDSPKHQQNLQRLQAAMTQVQGVKSRSNRLQGIWRILLTGLLAIALVTIFILWVFNRATLIETEAQTTRGLEAVSAQQTDIAKVASLAEAENTRTIEEIASQRNQIATIQADNTRIAGIAASGQELATVQAQATKAGATLTAIYEERSTATPTPVPSRTPVGPTATATPIVPVWDQLRVIGEDGANLRSGPGTNFSIVASVVENQIVDWLAQDNEGQWYNIQTAEGIRGWVHSSLVIPLALDDMPVAATVPATPRQFYTRTPTPPEGETTTPESQAATLESEVATPDGGAPAEE